MQTLDKDQLKRELESFIDLNSLADLASLISDICSEKADHIRENWQDESLAKGWEHAANVLATDAEVSLKHV